MSAKAASDVTNFLKAALNYAIKLRLIRDNPVTLASMPKVERKQVQPLSLDEARRLVAVLRDSYEPYADVLGMGLFTTVRTESELLGAAEGDFDLDRGLYHFQRVMLENGSVKPAGNSKSNPRTIELSAEAMVFMRRHQAFKREFIESWGKPEAIKPEDRLMFRSPCGDRIAPTTLRRRFKEYLEAAGIEPTVRIHDLRHTGATLLLAAGYSLSEVQQMGGWRDAGVLLRIYNHLLPGGAKRASDALGHMLGGSPPTT